MENNPLELGNESSIVISIFLYLKPQPQNHEVEYPHIALRVVKELLEYSVGRYKVLVEEVGEGYSLREYPEQRLLLIKLLQGDPLEGEDFLESLVFQWASIERSHGMGYKNY